MQYLFAHYLRKINKLKRINNKKYQTHNTNSPQVRFSETLFYNLILGVSTPPTAKSGNPLPGARTVSLVIYPDVQIEDPKWTLAAMQYGQIITHDMSMIAGSTQARKFFLP